MNERRMKQKLAQARDQAASRQVEPGEAHTGTTGRLLYILGMPDTSLRGRRTRTARSVRRSKPVLLEWSIVRNLQDTDAKK